MSQRYIVLLPITFSLHFYLQRDQQHKLAITGKLMWLNIIMVDITTTYRNSADTTLGCYHNNHVKSMNVS